MTPLTMMLPFYDCLSEFCFKSVKYQMFWPQETTLCGERLDRLWLSYRRIFSLDYDVVIFYLRLRTEHHKLQFSWKMKPIHHVWIRTDSDWNFKNGHLYTKIKKMWGLGRKVSFFLHKVVSNDPGNGWIYNFLDGFSITFCDKLTLPKKEFWVLWRWLK